MREWRNIPLGKLVTFQRGHDLPIKEIKDGEYPVIGSSGIIGYNISPTTKGPGIVIGRSGNSVGRVHYSDKDFWAHNTTLYVKYFHNTYPKFIYYLLKCYNLGRFEGGSAVPTLNRNHIHPLEFYVPINKIEQKTIASILSTLDSKIGLLRRQNQTFENIAQTLFKRWFVDFEFPDKNGKPYKSSGGKMVESELGEIPEGWEVGVIKDIGTVITGKTPSSNNPEHFGDFIPFVTPTDFRSYGKFILNSVRGISKKGKQTYEKYIIPEASIIVTCIGSDMGKVAITATPCITNQQINTIVFNSAFTGIEYLYQYLKNIYHLLRNIALGGSTMPIINKSAFENIDIILPDNNIIQSFENITKVFSNKIINNEEIAQTLTNTRDTLLPKLMSGQIRVKNL